MAVFVFDFDGTLVDSNAIKRRAYYEAVEGVSGADAILGRLLAAPQAGDRYEVMAKLSGELSRPELAEGLVASYTAIAGNAIHARLADGWAGAFADEMLARRHRLYVNSATPAAALGEILVRAGLSEKFAGHYGGHGLKAANLRGILEAERIARAVVVGDGPDDERSASECGCMFIRVDDGDGALFRRRPAAAADWIERQVDALSGR